MSVVKDALAAWGALSLAAGIAVIAWVEVKARAISRERRAGQDEELRRMTEGGHAS